MKRNHISKVMLLALAALAPAAGLSAAASNPCVGSAQVDGVVVSDFKAEPAGERMAVAMTLQLDSVSLKSNQTMVLTPICTGRDGSYVRLPKVYVNGRNAQVQYERGNYWKGIKPVGGDVVVRRKNGTRQAVYYSANVAYEPWMTAFDMVLLDEECGCGKIVHAGESQAISWPAAREPFRPVLAYVQPEAKVKTFELEKTSYIDFIVDRTDLRADYRRNPAELDSIYRTIMIVKNDPNITINNINIHGYASPESPYSHNAELASGRAATLRDYVSKLVDIPSSKFTSSSTPEDWEGLLRFLRNDYSLPLDNRHAIIRLASNKGLEPDAREAEIKRLYPSDYQKMLKEWYPALRRSDYRITYTVRGFSLEEAKEILKTKPSQLSLNELYMVAQSYPAGSPEFRDVMDVAVRLYPDDPTANLDAALSRLEAGDVHGADRFLEKAGDSPEALNARGVSLMLQGDEEAAIALFEQALPLPAASANLEAARAR